MQRQNWDDDLWFVLRWCIHCQESLQPSCGWVANDEQLLQAKSPIHPALDSMRLTGFTYAFQLLTWCGSPVQVVVSPFSWVVVRRRHSSSFEPGEQAALTARGMRRRCTFLDSLDSLPFFLDSVDPVSYIPSADSFCKLCMLCTSSSCTPSALGVPWYTALGQQTSSNHALHRQTSSNHQTSDTTVEAISVSHKWAGHIEVSSAKDALQTRGIYKVLIFDWHVREEILQILLGVFAGKKSFNAFDSMKLLARSLRSEETAMRPVLSVSLPSFFFFSFIFSRIFVVLSVLSVLSELSISIISAASPSQPYQTLRRWPHSPRQQSSKLGEGRKESVGKYVKSPRDTEKNPRIKNKCKILFSQQLRKVLDS